MKRLLILVVLLMALCPRAHALTQAELRYRASSRLGQDTSSISKQYADAELNAWINDAIRYISHVSLCYVRETTFALVTSKTDYLMSADYIKMQGVVIGSVGATYDLDNMKIGLKGTATADLGKALVVRATPTQWEDLGEIVRSVRLSPAPGLLIDTVRATYYAYSRTLTAGTDTCLLPLGFQFCIPDYVASQAWGRSRLPDPYWAWFIDRLAILVPMIQKRSDPEVPAAIPGGIR